MVKSPAQFRPAGATASRVKRDLPANRHGFCAPITSARRCGGRVDARLAVRQDARVTATRIL